MKEISRRKVLVRLRDIICPEGDQVFDHMTLDTQLAGEVSFTSDRGEAKEAFLVVELTGVMVPVIVPKEKVVELDRSFGEEKKDKDREDESEKTGSYRLMFDGRSVEDFGLDRGESNAKEERLRPEQDHKREQIA